MDCLASIDVGRVVAFVYFALAAGLVGVSHLKGGLDPAFSRAEYSRSQIAPIVHSLSLTNCWADQAIDQVFSLALASQLCNWRDLNGTAVAWPYVSRGSHQMAGFKTHITTSTMVGVGYGAVGNLFYDIPIPVAMVSAGLCSIAGILPDLDSDSGKPVREITSFSAAVIPMLMMARLRQMGLSHESIIMAGGCMYIFVRFGIGEMLSRFSVHRGMWHSIPAAAIAGLVAALLVSGEFEYRMFKVAAVVIGYLTHLILDEIWSIQFHRGRIRLKKSSGTALKFFGKSSWANFSTYAKLVICTVLVLGDPSLSNFLGGREGEVHRVARETVQEVVGNPFNQQEVVR